MRAVDVIERKVEGKELSGEEIAFLVNGYVDGSVICPTLGVHFISPWLFFALNEKR